METDVEDFPMEDDNQFSLEEMETALQSNDGVQLESSSNESQKSLPVLKELNSNPAKRVQRLVANKPMYRQLSSSDNSEVNTSSSNSSDNIAKQPAPKKKKITRLKKPLAKKTKYMDKENISENALENNNRMALLDRTNSSERLLKTPKDGKDANSDKVVTFARDGKDLNAIEKVVTGPVKEVVTEKPIPVYKQALGNMRLTPPPVDNKMDLYEFEIDENEQPVKKKAKRQPRAVKSRRKIAKKPVKNVLQNIVVPERTISLRGDTTVKENKSKTKVRFGNVKMNIVSQNKEFDTSDVAVIFEPEVRGRDQNHSVLKIHPAVTHPVQQSNKSDENSNKNVRKSILGNESILKATSRNTIPNRSVEEMRQKNQTIHRPILQTRSVDPAASKSLANDSTIDSEDDFLGFDDVSVVEVCSSSNANHSVHKIHPTANRTVNRSLTINSTIDSEDDFLGFDDVPVVDVRKDKCSSSNVNHSVRIINSTPNRKVNKSLANDSNIDFENNFGFDDEPDVTLVDVSKDKSSSSNANHSVHKIHQTPNRTVQQSNKSDENGFDKNSNKNVSTACLGNRSIKKVTLRNKKPNRSVEEMGQQNRTIHHPILHIRSVDPAANKSLANDSNIDFENNFGFDDEPDLPIVDVSKDKSSSSNPNHSVHKTHPTSRTVQQSKKSEAKFGVSNNFGFDDDSTNSAIVDKNRTKISNASTASTANTSIASIPNTSLASTSSASIKSTSNGSISNASTTSKLENDKAKKPEIQFNDVIKRLKGQLNITAVSTPVSTKQTKLNFSSFKNKSTVSNESAADTSICSPIAQPTSSSNLGLTPTFLKPPRKSYTHTPTAKKVVRFGTSFAFDQNEMRDDDELAKDLFEETVKEKPAPKKANQTYKKASKAGKKEEKEIERLVSAINSQFQKVEEFQLCVEK